MLNGLLQANENFPIGIRSTWNTDYISTELLQYASTC